MIDAGGASTFHIFLRHPFRFPFSLANNFPIQLQASFSLYLLAFHTAELRVQKQESGRSGNAIKITKSGKCNKHFSVANGSEAQAAS